MDLLSKISKVENTKLIAGIDMQDTLMCRHIEACYFYSKGILENSLAEMKKLLTENDKLRIGLPNEPNFLEGQKNTFGSYSTSFYDLNKAKDNCIKSLKDMQIDYFGQTLKYFESTKNVSTELLTYAYEKRVKQLIEEENIEKFVAIILEVCGGNFTDRTVKECFTVIRRDANCFTPIGGKMSFEKLYYDYKNSYENCETKINKNQTPIFDAIVVSLCIFVNGNPANTTNFHFSKTSDYRVLTLDKQPITGLQGVESFKFFKNGKFEIHFTNKDTLNAYYKFLQDNMWKWKL